MTLAQFKLTDPEQGRIRFFLSGGDQVIGVTVSIYNCNNINFTYPLQQLKKITFNGIELNLTSKTNYSTYFYYDCEPTTVDTSLTVLNDGNCDLVQFFPNIDPIPFTYNMYNAILGNTEDIRGSMYIYDVDRNSSQLQPSNIQAILSSSATFAKFQDSNYSDTGLVNARYEGTKTSAIEYGLDPLITVELFEGALYQSNINLDTICSQSLIERNIVEYGFDKSTNLVPSPDSLPTSSFSYFNIDGIIEGTLNSPASVSSSTTSFIGRMRKNKIGTYRAGDIIVITNGISRQSTFAQIQKVEFHSFVDTDEDNYRFDVSMNIDGAATTVTGVAETTYNVNILKVHSDTVYSFEGNKLVPISNKRIYIPITKQILKTSKGGRVLKVETVCSI